MNLYEHEEAQLEPIYRQVGEAVQARMRDSQDAREVGRAAVHALGEEIVHAILAKTDPKVMRLKAIREGLKEG